MNETRDLQLLATDAVVASVDREIVLASGADRSRFLHGILTGDVAGTPVGGGCHATLLNTKAHIVAEMRIFVRADDFYLAVPSGQGSSAAAALARYAIMDDFTATPHPEVGLIALLGPAAVPHLEAIGYAPGALLHAPAWSHAEVPGSPGSGGPAGSLWMVRARQLGTDGYWLGGAAATLADVSAKLAGRGVRRLAVDVAEGARIEAGEPAWGQEITDDVFPTEVGLGDAIDFGKGCFLGQEPLVRIRDRGHLNWRLTRLRYTSSSAGGGGDAYRPKPGDRLQTDAKAKAGRITSAAILPDGTGVALALVHVSLGAGETVRVLGDDATGARVGSALATLAA